MNNLCKLPFLHKYINFVDASEKPCCIFQGQESIFDVQKKFLNNERPEGCSECWRKEDNNILSKRQHFNTRFSDHDIDSGIKTYDLRLGITCNLKCVMCGPHLSTKWNEDKNIFEKYVNKTNDTPHVIEELNFDDALEIYFAGGEPFYMKEVYDCLLKLSERDFNRKNTKIRINTNAIIDENNKVLKLLNKFEKIEFTISVEGIEEINDYIRYPSKWKDFLKGVKIIYDLSDKPKILEDLFSCKRSVAFNITISCLNLNTIFDLFDWLSNNEYLYVANFVEEPTLLHINSLKPNEIEKFYAKHKKYRYPLTHLNDVAQYVIDNYKYDKKMNKKMETYLLALDIKRNTDRGILNG
jgi:organic radical activating enzyme